MIQLKAQLTFAFTLILYDYSDFFFCGISVGKNGRMVKKQETELFRNCLHP